MKEAVALFDPSKPYNNGIGGYIKFKQESPHHYVLVELNLFNIPFGYHGIHIHEKGLVHISEQENCCELLGGHFNPHDVHHGSFMLDSVRHVGDMINNICVDRSGHFRTRYIDTLVSLYESKVENIIGRSVIIHENRDDEGDAEIYALIRDKKKRKKLMKGSLTTGNSGDRIACAHIFPVIPEKSH